MPELIEHGTSGFLVDDVLQAKEAVECAGSLNRADVRDTCGRGSRSIGGRRLHRFV